MKTLNLSDGEVQYECASSPVVTIITSHPDGGNSENVFEFGSTFELVEHLLSYRCEANEIRPFMAVLKNVFGLQDEKS